MSYFRRDDWVQMAIGYAVPNTAVTYLTQPALALATLYNDAAGDQTISNPQYTDGFGHAVAYMAAGEYTITYSGAQIQTLTLPDQNVGGAGGGSTITIFSGTPQGTVNGVNRVFTLTNNGTPLTSPPTQFDLWLNYPLVVNVGYTISGVIVTYAVAPQPTVDTIWAQGYYVS